MCVCVCDASECVGAERTAAARDNLGRQLLDRHRLVALAADELCVRGGEKGVDEWLFPSAHFFATPPPRAKKKGRAPIVYSLRLSRHPLSISFCRRCSLSLRCAKEPGIVNNGVAAATRSRRGGRVRLAGQRTDRTRRSPRASSGSSSSALLWGAPSVADVPRELGVGPEER